MKNLSFDGHYPSVISPSLSEKDPDPMKKIKPMTILRRFSVYFQIYIFRKINIFLSIPCLNGFPPLPAKNRPKMNCPIQFVNSLKKGYKFLKIMLK